MATVTLRTSLVHAFECLVWVEPSARYGAFRFNQAFVFDEPVVEDIEAATA